MITLMAMSFMIGSLTIFFFIPSINCIRSSIWNIYQKFNAHYEKIYSKINDV